MPELPEVEMVARTLRPRLVGRRVLAVETSGLPLRRPVDRARLSARGGGRQRRISGAGGKIPADRSVVGATLLAHLGMSGRFTFAPPEAPRAPHTHVVFALDDGVELRYVDHRRFGILRVYDHARVRGSAELSILGPDPFEAAFTIDYLVSQLGATRRDVKTFLLDQTRIAGVGNIYACEALFLGGNRPAAAHPSAGSGASGTTSTARSSRRSRQASPIAAPASQTMWTRTASWARTRTRSTCMGAKASRAEPVGVSSVAWSRERARPSTARNVRGNPS